MLLLAALAHGSTTDLVVCRIKAKWKDDSALSMILGSPNSGELTAAAYAAARATGNADQLGKDLDWYCKRGLGGRFVSSVFGADPPNWWYHDPIMVLVVEYGDEPSNEYEGLKVAAVHAAVIDKVTFGYGDAKGKRATTDVDLSVGKNVSRGRGTVVFSEDVAKDVPSQETVDVTVEYTVAGVAHSGVVYAEVVRGIEPYRPRSEALPVIWVPGALASTDLGLSEDKGLAFVPLPVTAAVGVKVPFTNRDYFGGSVILQWVPHGVISSGDFNFTSFGVGGIIDIDGYLLLGGNATFDLTADGAVTPGLVVGIGPTLLGMLQ